MQDQVLDLADLVLGKQGPRELELLEDVRVARQIQGEAALVVGDGVVDVLLLEQEPHDLAAPLHGGDVQGCVAVFVPGVDVDVVGSLGEDVLDDGLLGALDGQVQDRGVLQGPGLRGDGGHARTRARLGRLPDGPGDLRGVTVSQRLDDAELANRLLQRAARPVVDVGARSSAGAGRRWVGGGGGSSKTAAAGGGEGRGQSRILALGRMVLSYGRSRLG
ncbi:hypothetical protein VTK73DRAFT_5653 [Phialemonium thermophilum]|uniref:Uncharacterized protein n=1 Tax=Phialemonium thermophilum TaxID=223376 RepID=A0ABR3V1F4_9PEZI